MAQVYVQGKIDFPALPSNFGWLLGVTGGTSVFSIMLTRARGSKGAGAPAPALSDLVSTGGVLAADRAQFLLWTLIGTVGYVVLVLKQSPEQIGVLPELRPDLVAVMGLGALVYIGGKAVRLPGPVINEVKPEGKPTAQDLTLTVKGQNLHKDALVSIDRQPVEVRRGNSTPMEEAISNALSSQLELIVAAAPWATGDHLLRLTNIDGQYAEFWFAADPPQLAEVTDSHKLANRIAAGTQSVDVTLAGSNLRPGSSVEWLPPGAAQPIPANDVQVSANKASATLKPIPGTQTGAGTITIVSPDGIRASRPVTVK